MKQDITAKRMSIITKVVILLSILIALLTMNKFESYIESTGYSRREDLAGAATVYVGFFILILVASYKSLSTFVKLIIAIWVIKNQKA